MASKLLKEMSAAMLVKEWVKSKRLEVAREIQRRGLVPPYTGSLKDVVCIGGELKAAPSFKLGK